LRSDGGSFLTSHLPLFVDGASTRPSGISTPRSRCGRRTRVISARVSCEIERMAGTKGWAGPSPPLMARLAPAATSPEQLRGGARAHGAHGQLDGGLLFAERAIRADPLDWRCQHAYTMLLFHKGRIDEAITANERAMALLPEQVTVSELFELHQRLVKA